MNDRASSVSFELDCEGEFPEGFEPPAAMIPYFKGYTAGNPDHELQEAAIQKAVVECRKEQIRALIEALNTSATTFDPVQTAFLLADVLEGGTEAIEEMLVMTDISNYATMQVVCDMDSKDINSIDVVYACLYAVWQLGTARA